MSDKDNPFDESFNFESEDFGESKFDEGMLDASDKSKPKIGKVPLAIGAVAILAVIFKLSGSGNDTAAEVAKAPEANTSMKSEPLDFMADAEPMEPVKPEPKKKNDSMIDDFLSTPKAEEKAQPEDSAPSVDMTALNKRDREMKQYIRRLEKQVSALTRKLDSVETTMRRRTTAANASDKKIDNLTREIDDLQSSVGSIHTTVKELINPQGMKRQGKKVTNIEASAPVWRIHAVIPGRAWLKNQEGQTITIIEGDQLDLYGTVLLINAPGKEVVTSSGVTIR